MIDPKGLLDIYCSYLMVQSDFEPLSIIAADDPVTCASYAKENDLLAQEGWHRLRNLAKKDKDLQEQSSKVRSDKSGDPKLTCLVPHPQKLH